MIRPWILVVSVLGVSALVAAGLGVWGETGPAIGHGTVTLPNGVVYDVEIPRTPETKQQGLMFREALPPRTGMLFIFEVSGRYPFWMKNCLIALDLIWLDERKRIIGISHDTPPCKKDPCPIYQVDVPNQRYVLEIAGGAAKREGLVLGDVVAF